MAKPLLLKKLSTLGGALALMMLVVLAAPANAGTPAGGNGTGAPVAESMARVLAAYPDAERLSANEVRLPNGVQVSAGAQADCSYRYLCLYSANNYRGEALRFFNCGFVDIGRIWGNNRTRSYINNQTPGTVSIFYNWTNPGWQEVWRSRAYNADPGGGGYEIAEGVRVC